MYVEPSYYRELSTNECKLSATCNAPYQLTRDTTAGSSTLFSLAVEISYSDLEFVERLGEDETGTTHWKGRWKSKHLVVSICRGRILSCEEVS